MGDCQDQRSPVPSTEASPTKSAISHAPSRETLAHSSSHGSLSDALVPRMCGAIIEKNSLLSRNAALGEMHMGQDALNEYLKDPKVSGILQPSKGNLRSGLRSCLDEAKAGRPDTNIAGVVHEAHTSVRETLSSPVLDGGVLELRNLISRLARSHLEIWKYSNECKDELVQECLDEGEALKKKIADLFSVVRERLTQQREKFKKQASDLEQRRSTEANWGIASIGTGGGGCLGGILGAVLPHFISASPTISAVSLAGSGALSCLGFARGGVSFMEAKRQRKLARIADLFGQWVQKNIDMWDGVMAQVKELEASLSELKSVSSERHVARRSLMHEVTATLFALSMSVDTYIYWLEPMDVFPPTRSIRILIGPERYDRFTEVSADPGARVKSVAR